MSIYYTCPDCFSHVVCGETCVCKKPQAIDLAAENERLKAKLDAVRKWASNPVRIDDFGYQMAQESVLDIIDKDGDET